MSKKEFSSIQVSKDIKIEFAKVCRTHDKIISRVVDRLMESYVSGTLQFNS